MPSSPTLVCFALPQEARPFGSHDAVRVVVTGMGRRNTERALAPLLAAAKPGLVLTCGFAGGLVPGLALNTVMFETTDAALATRLRAAGLREGRFHHAHRMAVTAVEKAALWRDTRADAVEMESARVHELCQVRGVPCATVRVISDAAEEDLPLDFNKLTTAEQKLCLGRLTLAVLCAPWKIPSLLRLQRQTASASAELASALRRVLRDQ